MFSCFHGCNRVKPEFAPYHEAKCGNTMPYEMWWHKVLDLLTPARVYMISHMSLTDEDYMRFYSDGASYKYVVRVIRSNFPKE